MTIRDLYNYAVQNDIVDDEIMIKTNDGKIICAVSEMLSPSYRNDITVINLNYKEIKESEMNPCLDSVGNNGNGLE